MSDRITYCDVCKCAECPRYGDDCDGDKRNGDLISRHDALKPFCMAPDGTRIPEVDCDNFPVEFSIEFIKKHLLSLPSAEAEPTVIRSRTFIPTKDFKEWARLIREVNPNAVVIPCDAEVVSAESVSFEDAMQIRNTILFKEYMRGRRDAEAVWIPCSERLPSKDGRYLVCMNWDYDNTDVLNWADGWNCCRGINGEVQRESEIDGTDILAWMPLPKPYREDGEA